MQVFTRANRRVAAAAQKILGTPAIIERPKGPVYQELTKLPPFRPVAVQLMQMFGQEEAGAMNIARLIEADPALAAEVMTLANSPLFGLSRNITTLTQAVTVLGFERVKALSAVITLRIMMDSAPKTGALRRCWRHSMACAHIAREVGTIFKVSPEEAYTAGILHDVGRFGLLATHADKYSDLCCIMHETQHDVISNEVAQFQTTHCQAGLFLVASWHLPEFFQGAVALHHGRNTGHGVVPLIQFSCLMADAIGMDAIRYKLPKLEAIIDLLPEDARSTFSVKIIRIEQAVADALKVLDF